MHETCPHHGTSDDYNFLPCDMPVPTSQPDDGLITRSDRPMSHPLDKHGNEVISFNLLIVKYFNCIVVGR